MAWQAEGANTHLSHVVSAVHRKNCAVRGGTMVFSILCSVFCGAEGRAAPLGPLPFCVLGSGFCGFWVLWAHGVWACQPTCSRKRDHSVVRTPSCQGAPHMTCAPSPTPPHRTCEPFVLGPALAMDSTPGPLCWSTKFSSSRKGVRVGELVSSLGQKKRHCSGRHCARAGTHQGI